ncbi:MAG: tetratricopeptide repeat protein [Pirellulaceae bacterium]
MGHCVLRAIHGPFRPQAVFGPTFTSGNVDLGQGEKAIADYSNLLELQPEPTVVWYWRSLARLGGGQANEYRHDCGELLRRFGSTDSVNDAYYVAWTDKIFAEAGQGTADRFWNRRLTLKLLRDEATAMLGVTPPAVEPAPAPAAKVEEAQELPKSTPAPEPAKEEEKPQ